MDIYKAILKLREEKRRLDRAIAALEQKTAPAPDTARRRSWDAGARSAAAERMKKYWELRKQGAPNGTSGTGAYKVKPASTDNA